MSQLNAVEVFGRLRELGHDYNPERQAYKASIAGHTCDLYDLNGNKVTVRASEVALYAGKGFSTEAPRAVAAAPAAARRKGK